MTKQFLAAIRAQDTVQKLNWVKSASYFWDTGKPRSPSLTLEQKTKIYDLRDQGLGYRDIAAKLGHSYYMVYNTIYRRNHGEKL